ATKNGFLQCYGHISTSNQSSYCLLPFIEQDSNRTRIGYSLIINTTQYPAMPHFEGINAPNAIVVGGQGSASRLTGMASALVMKAGNTYKRISAYTPSAMSESNFAYTETIPLDFAFGASATAIVASNGAESNCTFAAPVTGKVITFSSANCPLLQNGLTLGDWILFEYDIIAPQPDIFTGASK
ncbi:MAG TPA: hypothetical protein PLO51_06055, partial [Candidatus Micrarchaeota archaeon]|nr:hypothetical protein [Candidatus Micrarchaeota archaeon]